MPETKEDIELEKLGPHDSMLEVWVGTAERAGFGFSVTLSVGGMLISGVLVSQADYMKGFGDDLARAISQQTGDKESAEAMRAMLTSKAEVVEAKRKRELEREEGASEGDESEPVAPVNYIHLRDAVIHLHPARYHVRYWRGRLDAVDGWAPGSPSD